MANMVALRTLNDICLIAVFGLVTNFVALETHFFIAVERFMGVFAAEDAVESLGVVWAVFCHVTELLTVMTLYRNVFLCPIPLPLIFLQVFKC